MAPQREAPAAAGRGPTAQHRETSTHADSRVEIEQPILDQITELADMAMSYVRQETRAIIADQVLAPLHELRRQMVFGIMGAVLVGLATVFLAVGAFLVLQRLVGPIVAFWAVGAVVLAFGLVMFAIGRRR